MSSHFLTGIPNALRSKMPMERFGARWLDEAKPNTLEGSAVIKSLNGIGLHGLVEDTPIFFMIHHTSCKLMAQEE